MNWVKKHKLLAVKTVKYNNCLYLEMDNLWHILHSISNIAQNRQVEDIILDEIPDKHPNSWPFFLEEKFIKAITKCNNSSTARPDKLS